MSPAATNSTDTYAATAGAYDLFNQPFRRSQSEALNQVSPQFVHSAGPVLDIGAGSGLNTVDILENCSSSTVLAIEPSDTPSEFTDVTVGSLRYVLTGQARPIGDDRMRWTMTYTTLEGEKVLHEASTSHIYHHPPHSMVKNEAGVAGLSVDRLGGTNYWVARRHAT